MTFAFNVQYVTASPTCGQPGGEVVLALGTAQRDAGSVVYAEFFAGGSTIQRVTVRRSLDLRSGAGPDFSASPEYFLQAWPAASPNPSILEQCAWFAGCSTLDSSSTLTVPDATALRFQLHCGGGGYCAGAESDRARLALRSIQLSLTDNYPPSGSVSIGTVLSAGIHKGTETAKVFASDGGTGVMAVRALLDGKLAGSLAGGGANCHDETFAPGARDYRVLRPCDYSLDRELRVDTTVVADGTRRLQIVVEDASGNLKELVDRNIEVDNVPAPLSTAPPTISSTAPMDSLRPGDMLVANPGVWTGAGLSLEYRWQRRGVADEWTDIAGAKTGAYTLTKDEVGRTVRVKVIATNSDSSVPAYSEATKTITSGQTVQVASAGPQAAGGEGPSPQLVVDREQRTVQVHYGAKIVVTGRLVDADGAPIADADVDVFEQLTVVGAPWKKVATVKTDGQGGYVYRPVTQGSRTLRFAYSARRDSGDYRATRDVVISVTAAMSLRAVRKTIGSRGLIHLKGRVRAKPLPASGTWVEVQVLDAGVWRTIGTRKTSKTGRWSFKHRVRSVSRVTFAFRARLRPVANVPAAESKSTPVKVRVR